MEKEQLTISADLESSEKAKELLDDLEVPEITQVFKKTPTGFTINDFSIESVLKNGMTIEKLNENIVKVNVTFLAKREL